MSIWQSGYISDYYAGFVLGLACCSTNVLAIILEGGMIYLSVLLTLLVTYIASSNAQIIGMEYPSLGPHGFV